MFDGMALLGICDKIVPGLVIGALRFGHLPAVFVPSGPMPSGLANKEKQRVRQLYAEGKVGRDQLLEVGDDVGELDGAFDLEVLRFHQIALGRDEQHAVPALFQKGCELRGARGFSRAIHADDEDDLWLRRERAQHPLLGGENFHDLLAGDLHDAVGSELLLALLQRAARQGCEAMRQFAPHPGPGRKRRPGAPARPASACWA